MSEKQRTLDIGPEDADDMAILLGQCSNNLVVTSTGVDPTTRTHVFGSSHVLHTNMNEAFFKRCVGIRTREYFPLRLF